MTEKKQKSPQLKLTTIQKKAKEVNKKIVHEFEDGNTLTFYPIFPETLIKKLLIDYQSLILESKDKGIEISEEMVIELIHLLCIKHFTHLGNQIEDGILNHFNYLESLNDAEYYKPIMEEVFLPKEIQKVYERFTDLVGMNQTLEKLNEKAGLKFESLQVKYKDAFEEIEKLKVEKQIPEV